MKNKLIHTLIAVFAIGQLSYAQYFIEKFPIDDAINYVAAKEDSNHKEMITILSQYYPETKGDHNKLQGEVTDIPFLATYTALFSEPEKSGSLASINALTNSGTAARNKFESAASAGAADLLGTPLIDVLGTFMATRFREELTTSFLESFRKKLQNEPYLGSIFSNAKLVLLNEDVFNHKAWLASFRASFYEDLKELPKNIPILIQAITKKKRLTEDQRKKVDLVLGLYEASYDVLKTPSNNYKVISTLLSNLNKRKDLGKAKGAINLAHIIVKEFGINDQWVSAETFTQLKVPEVFETFIGFLVVNNKEALKQIIVPILDNDGNEVKSNAYEYLTGHKELALQKFESFISNLEGFVKASSDIIDGLKQLKEDKPDGSDRRLTFTDYKGLVAHTLEGFKTIVNSDLMQIMWNDKAKEKLLAITDNSTSIANYSFEVSALISEKKFVQILPKTLQFLEDIVPQETRGENAVLKTFLKYANLAVNLVDADSKEELAEALENTALPVSSYRIKRNSHFSVSLNGYAGFSGGLEYLTGADITDPWNGIFRFSAPIGVGLNWGLTSKKTKYTRGISPTKSTALLNSSGAIYDIKERAFTNHSISAFISIVDLGAVTAFRLSNTTTPIENINWGDVFSPGLRIVWGMGKTPLAFGVGAQYLPSLREINAVDGGTTTTFQSNSLVFDATLTVDIPIFHFYTQTDKYKVKQDKPKKDTISFEKPSSSIRSYTIKELNKVDKDEPWRQRLEVKLHDTKNYTDAHLNLAEQARDLLDTIINSQLFKDKLLEMEFTQRNGLSKEQVYDLIMGGEEHSRIVGKPNVMDLYVRTITPEDDGSKWMRYCRKSTIGKEGDCHGYISTCKQKLDRWVKNNEPYVLAGHYAHEYLHNLGFKHTGNSKKKRETAVYKIGYLIRDLAELYYKK